ncbi:MAG: bis(5'-nucleosyl)-tetraphosphatase (symmetrical) YqeK [Treponema sp.]|nr:bis(5'-nucleosyl)-tetraphosphatase (symmetrical) YqeK [Treponema sp.]
MVSQKYDDKTCYEKIREYAEEHLSKNRYEHSVRVAETAASMCRLYGLDENLGLISGIAHDICKEIPAEEKIALAKEDGKPIEGLEAENPDLLHGRAAGVKIGSEFGIFGADVVQAIANHTFGKPGLCDLGKILFVADKIEPGRPQSTDEYRANLFSKTLLGITRAVLEENIDYLQSRGKSVAPVSLGWAKELRDESAE